MLFNSLTFIVFFGRVAPTGTSGLGSPQDCFSWRVSFLRRVESTFCRVAFATTALDFSGRKMGKVMEPRDADVADHQRGGDLSMLGFFKYGNFSRNSNGSRARRQSVQTAALDVFMPIGISFYTFHSLSYTLDIYRA